MCLVDTESVVIVCFQGKSLEPWRVKVIMFTLLYSSFAREYSQYTNVHDRN